MIKIIDTDGWHDKAPSETFTSTLLLMISYCYELAGSGNGCKSEPPEFSPVFMSNSP